MGLVTFQLLVPNATCTYTNIYFVPGAQENGDLRLRDGLSGETITGGRVEIYLNKVWGTLDAGTDKKNMTGAARTACRQLGYDSEAYVGTVSSLKYVCCWE